MINKDNFRQELKNIPVKDFSVDLKELHNFVIESTENGTLWDCYDDLGIKPVMDHYFITLNEFLKSKDNQVKPSNKTKEIVKSKPTHEKRTKNSKPSSEQVPEKHAEDSSIEFVERVPDELRFIRRYISLNGKRKSKQDLLLFINALHRAISSLVIRKASPYADQIRYIQSKLVSKHNTMSKPEIYNIPAKIVEQLKEIVHSFKVMPSVNLIKRYITLNGRYGVKEKAQQLIEAFQNAIKKGRVTKTDKYRKIYERMISNLKTYIKNKSQKVLQIEQSELNGLNGLLGVEEESDSHRDDMIEPDNKTTSSETNKKSGGMSIEEAKNASYETIGLTGKYLDLIGNACRPTHLLAYGEGGSGKSSFILKYCEYLNLLGHRILFVAGEQYNTPTFKELLIWLNINGNKDFAVSPDLNEYNPADFHFVALDSKDSLDLSVNDFRELKKAYKHQSFIISSQGTKDGDFTGSGKWRNEVDTMIYCEKGIAKTTDDKNRWGGRGEMNIIENETTDNLGVNHKKSNNQKDNILYDILSPDGFTIRMPGEQLFTTKEESNKHFAKWKKKFEAQGYYSSNSARISLSDLEAECSWEEIPASKVKNWFGFKIR